MVATMMLLSGLALVVGYVGILAFSYYQEKLSKEN